MASALAAGCASAKAPVSPPASAPEPKAAAAGILDTHTHFYDPRRPQGVPWPPKGDPVLYRTVLPAEYEALAAPLGITGTVVVEASPWVEDNQWVLDLAKGQPFLRGLVGHLEPGAPDFQRDLKRFAANPLFRGIRIGVWNPAAQLASDAALADLRVVADLGLAVDVITSAPQLLPLAELADRLPALRLVIDHCAGVRIDGKAPPPDWLAGIRAAARRHNIYMKVSGLAEGTGRADGSAPGGVDYYIPVLDAIWEAFGPRRVIFGSNWPVCSRFASLAQVHGIVDAYFTARGKEAAEAYFRGNAGRVYHPV